MPLTAHRLTINFESHSQIVTLSETGVSATLTFTSTFAIYDTLMKRPPGELKKPENCIIANVFRSFSVDT